MPSRPSQLTLRIQAARAARVQGLLSVSVVVVAIIGIIVLGVRTPLAEWAA